MDQTGRTLPEPRRDWAMFLDIDGTLLDLAPTPSDVVVPPALPGLLRALDLALGGAVAVITGRTLTDADALLAPLAPVAAGQHGAEIRWPDGTIERPVEASALAGFAPRIRDFAAKRPGLLVEDKGMTIAVHCRQAPQYQDELGRFLAHLAAERAETLEAIQGHRVFEIKPRALSKRTAVERFMAKSPFQGRIPVFIGDDRTDEDGFQAVRAQGGIAIRVGPEAPSLALLRIGGPTEVREFLSHVVEALNEHVG